MSANTARVTTFKGCSEGGDDDDGRDKGTCEVVILGATGLR